MSAGVPGVESLGQIRGPGRIGAVAPAWGALTPEEIARVGDPSAATSTLHWGRNYLYTAKLAAGHGESVDVVVKQFREETWFDRQKARRRGTKAERSFRAALAVLEAGVPTPEPIFWSASAGGRGHSLYVCRHVAGVEVRYLFRAAAIGREREEFPAIDLAAVLREIGRLARRLHDHGIRHRDFSVGNLLVLPPQEGESPALTLLDLNRARFAQTLDLSARMRELSRLALFRAEHRALLLEGYFGRPASDRESKALAFAQGAFEGKNATKKRIRGLRTKLLSVFRARRAHPHIPDAPSDAAARDKIVWDALSDQPHQHASRWEKLTVRVGDVPAHARELAAFATAYPRVRRRFRELERDLFARPIRFDGAGVCVRPLANDPERLLTLVEDLGARNVLLRLHPWEEDHDAEESLARALFERGYDLTFALPQNRDLVRDPARWRAAIEEISERFLPFGQRFQVGQAINRSKWGAWTLREYADLAVSAREILRAERSDVEILGPAVIDFEPHATAAALNLKRPGLTFDAVASLLYVDRRGAPENSQLGFDTVGKLRLIRAIAETSRNVVDRQAVRSWVTEVNWPLREGPHSPAGKSVAVSEPEQADYLVRYFLLALTSGMAERVYWWQLIAKGYGLVDQNADGSLRCRPSYTAFQTMLAQLGGTTFERRLPSPAGTWLLEFRRDDGGRVVAGWSVGRPVEVAPPAVASFVQGTAPSAKEKSELSGSVHYFLDGT